MLDDVIKRLAFLGYTVTDADSWGLDFIISKVESKIKNDCNISSVSDGLHQIAVDMAVGEFLLSKKSTNQLTGFDIEGAVKSISEGDTSITFAGNNEERMNQLIAYLSHDNADFSSYRCIKW